MGQITYVLHWHECTLTVSICLFSCRCLCVLINMVLRTMHEKLLDIGTLDSAAESTMVRLDEIRNCDRRVSTAVSIVVS